MSALRFIMIRVAVAEVGVKGEMVVVNARVPVTKEIVVSARVPVAKAGAVDQGIVRRAGAAALGPCSLTEVSWSRRDPAGGRAVTSSTLAGQARTY